MKRFILLAAVWALLLGWTGQATADTIVVVTPSSLNGWTPTGGATFVTGPATPPLGTGSVNLQADNSSAQIYNATFASGINLESLNSLSFSTYVTSNNGQQFPYLELSVDLGGGSYDQLFFDPEYQTQPTALNTWQTWDALHGGWWDSRGIVVAQGAGVAPLSAYFNHFDPGENGTINPGVSGYTISLGAAFASSGDQFNGYVDNFTIGYFEGETRRSTTFNFEPNAGSSTSSTPEPARLTLLAIGIAAMAGYGWRRRKVSGMGPVLRFHA